MLVSLRKCVLVIGAAHIDTIVERDEKDRDLIDAPGRVVHSIGGVGFNLAVNLGLHLSRRRLC
jgi:sugar/nucleoside kinase (ribokinase family)